MTPPREIVLRCLREYADRGIFRGFGASEDRNGSLECRFLWHAPEPHRLRFDPGWNELVFVDLLPEVPYPSEMDRELRRFVAGRSSDGLPAHRRIDPAKVSCRCRNRGGKVSIEVRCLDGDVEYAASKAVKLVNEIFLNFLAGPYDGYMIEHFGAPEE
ncbi:MAG: hypothetical protein OXP74_12190 [Acidobacteriota bacterium]|nr:hypothetical protein [Acidobacteriota bacterium]